MHKWLYDRRAVRENAGRTLTEEEITHYTCIAAALRETITVMQEIDTIIKSYGGFPLRGSGDSAPSRPIEIEEQDTLTPISPMSHLWMKMPPNCPRNSIKK